MRWKLVVAAAAALVFAALAGTARANGVPQFDLKFGLSACIASPCDSTLPANESFSVRGGYVGDAREDLVNPSYRFELAVDGVTQQGILNLDLANASKFYVYNFRDGMTGTHTFVGCWYGTDGSLSFCGARTVTFT
jgi:hypothetical protein